MISIRSKTKYAGKYPETGENDMDISSRLEKYIRECEKQ